MQPRLCAWAWARIPPEAPTGVLNAAAVFKLPGGSIRGDRDRILPDRLRYRIRDHRNGSRHRPHAQHQIHRGEFVAEIATGQRQDATQELPAIWGPADHRLQPAEPVARACRRAVGNLRGADADVWKMAIG